MKFDHEEIRPAQVEVDIRFQRELKPNEVQKIAANFRPELFGVPVVSRRSKARVSEHEAGLVAVDGQHRLAAAVAAGFGKTPFLMKVHRGLSLQEEAELFLLLNSSSRHVGVFDKFKARVVAEEPNAIAIVATLKKLSLKITKSRQNRGVCAITAVEYAHRHMNLEKTMHVLTAWDDGHPEALEGELIRAVSAFLAEYHAVDLDNVIQKLHAHEPERVMRKLRGTIGSYDFRPYEAACIVLREIYNHRRTKQTQLPPPGYKNKDKKSEREELQENIQRLKKPKAAE